MTTERTFNAVRLGPVDLDSPTGTVRVSADHVDLRGTAALAVRASTVSGRKRIR